MKPLNLTLTLIFVLSNFTSINANKDRMISYTQKDILKDLDEAGVANPYKFWFDLNHPYFNPSGSRITLFADENRWAIVFEKSGYSNSGFDIEIELTYFGNCLSNLNKEGSDKQFIVNSKTIILADDKDLSKLYNDVEYISPKAKKIKIRDTLLTIEHDIKKYENKKIDIEEDEDEQKRLDIIALTRYLNEQNPQLFRATEKEIKKCIPQDLPKIFTIDKWYQNEYSFGQGMKPSENETFQLISNILVTKDTTLWKPKLSPNNDWRNWPDAGSL